MNSPRPILFFAVLVIGFFLWQAWQQDYAAKPPVIAAAKSAATEPVSSGSAVPAPDVPTVNTGSPVATPAAAADVATASANTSAQRIDIRTDLLHAVIDTRGGSLVEAELLAYPIDPSDRTKPVRLLDDSNEHYFVVQSGLVSSTSAAPDHRALFSAEKTSYELAPGADTIEVPLTWHDASGVSVRKVYIFKRASYLVATREEVSNGATTAWTGNEYRQLQRVPPVVTKHGLFSLYNPEAYAFAGAAVYSPQDKFQKLAFAKFTDSPLRKADVAGGWVAMLQHYFFAAWIADPAEPDQFATEVVRTAGEPRYLVRSASPALTPAPNS